MPKQPHPLAQKMLVSYKVERFEYNEWVFVANYRDDQKDLAIETAARQHDIYNVPVQVKQYTTSWVWKSGIGYLG